MGGWAAARRILVWVAGLGVAAALLAVPRLGIYHAYLGTEILIAGLFALAFNLLLGYTGLLSFGQAAFFGIGAYGVAILLRDVTSSFVLAVLGAALLAGLAAILIGYLSVRLDEIFFAMLTLSLGMMVYTVAHQWRSFTGGSDGLTRFTVPDLSFFRFHLELASIETYYYVTLAVVSLSAWILWRIVHSPFGYVLRGLRENPERVRFAGLEVRRYRLIAFVVAGFFSGVAGALLAPFEHIASPAFAHWSKSAEPVLMTMLGGSGVFLGPAMGAAVFVLLEDVVTRYTEYWQFVLGALLVVLTIFFPRGLVGSVVALAEWAGLARERARVWGQEVPGEHEVCPSPAPPAVGGPPGKEAR